MKVCILYRKGYKISKIAGMKQPVFEAKINSYKHSELDFGAQLDQLMQYVVQHDETHFNQFLDHDIAKVGLEQTMLQLVFPLFDKMNLAWIAGSLTQEHQVFVSKHLKAKIKSCIAIMDAIKIKAKCIVYLPPDQNQELSLLFFHYLLKKNNYEVINLGKGINLSEVCSYSEAPHPELIFTILNEKNKAIPLQQYLDKLSLAFPKTNVLVLGYQTVTADIKWPATVKRCYKLAEAIEYIKK